MSGAFKFDATYQRSIVALMVQDYTFLSMVSEYLKPAFFDSVVLSWFFTTIRDYYLDYTARPTKRVIRRSVKKALKRGSLKSAKHLAEISKILSVLWVRVPDKDYLTDEVQSFIKHQAIKNTMFAAIPLLQKEQFDEIAKLWQQALSVGSINMDLGTRYFHDYRERIINRRQERVVIPTGIIELDSLLAGGGLGEKELGLILAPPSRGKSMCMVQLGKAGLVRKFKGVLYTFEMSEQVYAERFDVSWSGVDMRATNPDIKKVLRRVKSLGKMYGDSFIIKEFPAATASVNTIRAHLEQLATKLGFFPDFMLVDYVELMKAVDKQSEKRFEIGQAVTELRGLATELVIPIWSAIQANRKALSKRTITIQDLSESFEPAKHADVIVALCQTEEEFDDSEMRLFLAKNRNFIAHVSVLIRTAFEKNQFYRRVT